MANRVRVKVSKQFEYGINILLNTAFLVVANNILSWGVLPWLTQDFQTVLLLLNISLIAAIVVNIIFLAYNARWFVVLGHLFLGITSLVVLVRLFQVFPFDFSAYDAPNWEVLLRIGIIVGIVGLGISLIVEAVVTKE